MICKLILSCTVTGNPQITIFPSLANLSCHPFHIFTLYSAIFLKKNLHFAGRDNRGGRDNHRGNQRYDSRDRGRDRGYDKRGEGHHLIMDTYSP